MARYGGRPVSSEKTGTKRRQAMPAQNTKRPRVANGDGGGNVDSDNDASSSV